MAPHSRRAEGERAVKGKDEKGIGGRSGICDSDPTNASKI